MKGRRSRQLLLLRRALLLLRVLLVLFPRGAAAVI